MRKVIFTLMGLVILFTACSTEESGNTAQRVKVLNDGHFYGIKTVEHPRGVAQIKKLWYPGTTIDIRFLNGSESFHQKVKTYAAEWEQYADIIFNFIEEGDADVRISFDSNESRYVTWSTIGTDCKMIPDQSEPTMNFVDWDYLYEDEIKGDVLRAFGQVLGLELEHRHIDFDAGWRDNISLYWEGSIEDIPWEELKKYVFDPLEASKVLQTDAYDEESIMIWPFPRQFALNTARDYNYELSEKDKEFISSVYPKAKTNDLIIMIKSRGGKVGITFPYWEFTDLDLQVDWGYGIKEPIYQYANPYYDYAAIEYNYNSQETINNIKIYGSSHNLKDLIIYGEQIVDIDVAKCGQLEYLSIENAQISSIDLTDNIFLKSLHINSNELINLDLSNNQHLEYLYLYNSSISLLDVSNNPKIYTLICTGSNLSFIDLKNNLELKWLEISKSLLDALDVSLLTKLTYLNCSDNQIAYLDLSNNINLTELNFSDNDIVILDLSFNQMIKRIYCDGNPLVLNQENFVNFAESLPTISYGYLYRKNKIPEISLSWVNAIVESKGWRFYNQY